MKEQDIMVAPDSYFSLCDDWKIVLGFLKDHDDEFTEELEQKIQNLNYFFGVK